MNEKEKVYCKDCFYLSLDYTKPEEWSECRYPENILEKETWLEITQEYNELPMEINENNDCEWYERKKIPGLKE